jgi:hypothetical protein
MNIDAVREWTFLFWRDGEVVETQKQTTLPPPYAVFPVTYMFRGAHGDYAHYCVLCENGPCRMFNRVFQLVNVSEVRGKGVATFIYLGLRRAQPLQTEGEKGLDPRRLPE